MNIRTDYSRTHGLPAPYTEGRRSKPMKTLARCGALMLASAGFGLAAEPALLNLLMPEARAAAGVDVQRALHSPLGQFLLARLDPQAVEGLDRFREATGFDPRTDLREVVAAFPGGPGDERRLAAAAGSFQRERIVAAARGGGAEVSLYQGVEVVSFGAGTRRPSALAFLSDSLAVSGDPASVRLAIDRYRRPGPALNAELASRIAAVSAGADAWFVCLVPGSELAGAPGAGPKAAILGAIRQAAGSLRLGATVVAEGEIVAVGPEEARDLADSVRLLAGLARLSRRDPKAAALAELLNFLEVSVAGDTLRLRLAVPESRLESLIQTLGPR